MLPSHLSSPCKIGSFLPGCQKFGTQLLSRHILASVEDFLLIPFGQLDKQQSSIDSTPLATARVDIRAMVVRYFRFGRVARHRQPKTSSR
jgi:hypothetical protein